MDTNKQTSANSLACLIIGMLVASAFAREPALRDEQARQAEQIHRSIFSSSPLNRERLNSLTEAERSLLASYYRSYIEQQKHEGETDDSLLGNPVVDRLALLGDDWARRMIVEDFWRDSRGSPRSLEMLRDPKIIPMIGEGLFWNEVYEIHVDVGLWPTQANVGSVILHTLSNSAEFNEEATAWAKRIGPDFTMQMMREWYRANEAALKAGNFKAVRPGRERADFPRSEPAPIIYYPGRPGATPTTLPASPERVASPAAGTIGPARRGVPVWIWAAGCAAVLGAVGWLVWKVRRRGSNR